MREIKFRAKTIFGWEFGGLIHITETYKGEEDVQECDIWQLVNYEGASFDIDKETIGQFTDLYDKNKVPIYEGDIIQCDDEYWVVSFEYGKFVAIFDNVCEDLYEISDYGVIGNVYENSDLLGG